MRGCFPTWNTCLARLQSLNPARDTAGWSESLDIRRNAHHGEDGAEELPKIDD